MAMNLRLSEGLDRKLTEYAEGNGLSKLQAVRKAIRELVRQEGRMGQEGHGNPQPGGMDGWQTADTGWIPTISGKHPEECQSVYVTAETGGPRKIFSIYEAVYENGEYVRSSGLSGLAAGAAVTAWMQGNVPNSPYISEVGNMNKFEKH